MSSPTVGEATALLTDHQVPAEETPAVDGNPDEVKLPVKKPHPIAIAAPLFVHCFALSLSLIPIQQWLFLYVCSQTPQTNGLPDYSWETCRKNDTVHVCLPYCLVGNMYGVLLTCLGNARQQQHVGKWSLVY